LLEHFVMPGFIDTHVHVTLRPELNGSIFNVSSSKKALLGAHALNNLLMNGFTTVRDVGDMDVHGYTTSDLSKSIAEGLIIGSRLISSGHLISARGGHGDGRGLLASDSLPWQNSLADGVSELRSVVRDEISRGAKWIKFAGSGGFGSPSDDPNQVTYSQEEMNVIVSTAKDLGIPATLHVYGDEGIRRALKAGVTSIEHANLASKKTLDLISKNNVYVVPTQITVLKQARMANNDKFWEEAGRPDFVRKKYQKYSQQLLDSANNLANSDVKIVFGSDIGTFSFEKNNAEEFSEMVSNGISPARALKAGTSVAAEMLDINDIGIIKVGNRADIIAINGNPFENIRATESVLFVMQDGLVRKELKA
jgi:imidazolonepropionase-like amidohydrolase